MAALWWLLPGCPWISPSEHERNHDKLQALLDGNGDADADADSDSDVDTDTDSDTDLPCEDDPYEPNDSLLTLAPLEPPTTAHAVVCGSNVSPVYGIPLDLYSVSVGTTDVLQVSLGDAKVPCADLALTLQVTDEAGVVFPGATAVGGCPTLKVGWGAETYLVWVSGQADLDQPYNLHLEPKSCRDLDGDGYLDAGCGGPDCQDDAAAVFPGAVDVPLDTVDQDCDGGDQLESGNCPVVLAGATVGEGTLPCADLKGATWDRWQVPGPTTAADGLSVVVQNGSGDADLLAIVVAADGSTHYGGHPDRSQLDDEVDCAQTAWTGATRACPGACVWNGGVGLVDVWVAQYPGTGCSPGAAYTLVVYSDAVPVAPTLLEDDVPFSP